MPRSSFLPLIFLSAVLSSAAPLIGAVVIRNMNRNAFGSGIRAFILLFLTVEPAVQGQPSPFELRIEQITSGTKHHFFGYIGQCKTIPWNASGRYILGLEIDEIDRLPEPEEAATIILIDTQNGNRISRIDKTHAWNPQQGTTFGVLLSA